MKAVVLAAGAGSRLGSQRPKCMTPLGGRPLLHWQLETLRAAGIRQIAVVVGHRADQVDPLGAEMIANERHRSTNMVESLFCAREWIGCEGADTLVTYGDLVFDRTVLAAALGATDADVATVVGREWLRLWSARFANPLDDAESLRLRDGWIAEIGRRASGAAAIEGQYVGITRLSAAGLAAASELRERRRREGGYCERMQMTELLQALVADGVAVRAIEVERGWLELDTPADLSLYERIIAGDALTGWIGWPPRKT